MKKFIPVVLVLLSQVSYSFGAPCPPDGCKNPAGGLATISTFLTLTVMMAREEIVLLQEDAKIFLDGGTPSDLFFDQYKSEAIASLNLSEEEFALYILSH